MRALIDILHPAHVHFFRPLILALRERGHEIKILSRHKDVAVNLLDAYDLDHTVISTQRAGKLRLAAELAQRVAATKTVIYRFKPDVVMGLMGPSIALAGAVTGARTVVFYDNETTHKLNAAVSKLASAWISPRAYKYDYGAKHVRYDGYHELAYLHPNRFTPDPDRLYRHGLNPAKPFSILRFVAWESIHDGGESGFSLENKRKSVEILSRLGPVYISSEKPLPREFEPHRLNLPVHDVHHALAAATIVAGESSTMASEAACLGAHAIFVSKSGRGVNDEQQERYGVSYNFNGGRESDAIAHLEAAVRREPQQIKREAMARRDLMLKDVVDVTQFNIDYMESLCQERSQAA
jgi:uncharacterized protein